MSSALFADVALAPRDPILGLTEAFVADNRPDKVRIFSASKRAVVQIQFNSEVPGLRPAMQQIAFARCREDAEAVARAMNAANGGAE